MGILVLFDDIYYRIPGSIITLVLYCTVLYCTLINYVFVCFLPVHSRH